MLKLKIGIVKIYPNHNYNNLKILLKYLVFFYCNLMISPSDIQNTKVDLTLVSTVLVVSNLVSNQLVQAKLFDEAWMNGAVATLLGFALHGLITNKFTVMVNKELAVKNNALATSVGDFFKFGTVFVCQRAIGNYIEGKPIVFDEKWAMGSGLVIAGYSAFNFIEPMVPRVEKKYQPLLNDLIKVSMGALAANYFMDGTVNQGHLMSLAATLAGFTAFHLFTKRFVVPEEKFSELGGYSVLPAEYKSE